MSLDDINSVTKNLPMSALFLAVTGSFIARICLKDINKDSMF